MGTLRNAKLMCILFAFLFGHGFINGQDWNRIDSLKNINRAETDSIQIVKNYYELATCFRTSDLDSSLHYSHKGLFISDSINYIQGSAKFYYNIAHCYYRNSQYKLSLSNFNTAASLFASSADSLYLMKCYNNIGALFSFGNNQVSSLEFHLKSLKIAEQLHDTLGLANCYNNLGYLYQRINEYDKSVAYFEKTLLLDQLSGNKGNIALSHANLGFVLMKQNQKEQARQNYNASINLLSSIEDPYFLADMYLAASEFYFYTNQLDSAKLFIDKAQTICTSNDFPQIQASVYGELGDYFMNQKMYSQSVYWFNKSLDLSISKGITEFLPEIYLSKSAAYAHLNQYKKAYDALCLANSTKDSLKYSNVAVMIKEYEKEQEAKRELQRQQLEQQLINQKAENSTMKMKLQFQIALSTVILFGIVLMVTIVFIFTVRKNNKVLRAKNSLIRTQKDLLETNVANLEIKEKKLQQLVATKDKFFSIIAHDLRSPFNGILGFSNILEESIQNKDYTNIKVYSSNIHKASQKTISLINNLIEWSRSQTNRIEFKPECIELGEVINDIVELMNLSAQQKSIAISLELPDNTIAFCDKSMIRTILRNLISNAIKFTNKGGRIIVSVERKQHEYHISISDNGVGIPKEMVDKLFKIEENVSTDGTQKESGTGLGLILCKEFAEKHDGKILVKSNPGTGSTFIVILPIKEKMC